MMHRLKRSQTTRYVQNNFILQNNRLSNDAIVINNKQLVSAVRVFHHLGIQAGVSDEMD